MKLKVCLILVLSVVLLSYFNVIKEVQGDIISDFSTTTEPTIVVKPVTINEPSSVIEPKILLPVNVIENDSSVVFSFNIDKNLYSINDNNVEFYVNNGKDVFKCLLVLSNCSINKKTREITADTQNANKMAIGKIFFIGKDTGNLKENLSIVKKANTVEFSSVLVQKVFLIKDDTTVSIQIEANITVIKKTDIAKELNNNLLFVNRNNLLPEGYEPKNLANLDKNKIILSNSIQKLLPMTIDALYTMIGQARKEGIEGYISDSTYRDINNQKYLFNRRVAINKRLKVKDPYLESQKRVALPGASEHQTGLALDIYSTNGYSVDSFGYTAQSKWLKNNSWKFGFIVRYPEDKQSLTYTMYEPWHIRYVGYPYSAMLFNENICLEEFMGYMKKYGTKMFTQDKKNYLLIYLDSINDLKIIPEVTWKLSQADQSNYILTLSY